MYRAAPLMSSRPRWWPGRLMPQRQVPALDSCCLSRDFYSMVAAVAGCLLSKPAARGCASIGLVHLPILVAALRDFYAPECRRPRGAAAGADPRRAAVRGARGAGGRDRRCGPPCHGRWGFATEQCALHSCHPPLANAHTRAWLHITTLGYNQHAWLLQLHTPGWP